MIALTPANMPSVDETLEIINREHDAWRAAWDQFPRLGLSFEDWMFRRFTLVDRRLQLVEAALDAAHLAYRELSACNRDRFNSEEICAWRILNDIFFKNLFGIYAEVPDVPRSVLLEEYYQAHQAVEQGVADFELHNTAVDRLRRATYALWANDTTKAPKATP